MKNESNITLDHGEGGAATHRLIKQIFHSRFASVEPPEDAAIIPATARIAFTTDSFVVRPLCFPGGDIGKLAVCGTINDLAVMGAIPKYLSCALILEEGLEIAVLERIIDSMAITARQANVSIVAGDTKVVERGNADGMYINTSGIGFVPEHRKLSSAACRDGDVILVSGNIAEHGIAVMLERGGFAFQSEIKSDCRPLHELTEALLQAVPEVRCMRDPTRGGLATTLNEIASASQVGMILQESLIPIGRPVRTACDILGLDPLYVACEGCLIAIVPECSAQLALDTLRKLDAGSDASVIGRVDANQKRLLLQTTSGGMRPLLTLEGAQLPRIC